MSTDLCKVLATEHVEYIQNSGHFFAQLGDYYDCVDLPYNSTYFMANFINNRTSNPAQIFYGFCLPTECSPDFIEDVMNTELARANPILQAMLGFPLAVGSIDVNPQDKQYPFSGWFYLTVVLLVLLGLMGIIAAVKGLLTNKKEKKGMTNKKEKKGTVSKVIESFNCAQNIKIFQYKQNYLNIFNGVKTFAMFWVIFGHLFSVRLKYNVNITGIPSIVEQTFFVFVTGGFLAVDVFFFIGGFLVAYSFMRQKSKSLLKYPMAVVHRLLRFWPSYVMIILIYYSVQIHTGGGPLWDANNTLGSIPDCQGGWKSLLFIDNLVDNGAHMCLPWGWYLQNDMQIFVFSLIFIVIYMKHRVAGYICILAMMSLGLSLNIYEVIHREIKQVTHLIDFVKWQDYFTNIYIKPWIRCPPYLLGLTFGLLHMEYLAISKKLKEDPEDSRANSNFFVKMRKRMLAKRWVVWMSQLLGVALMITTVMLPHNMQLGHTWPYWAHGIYLSLEKVTFTFGIYLLILPTLMEVPNLAFFLLDTRFFNFTGKISFWVYLFHFMIVERVCFQEKVDFYYSPETVIPLFFSVVAISFLFGFIGTMMIEAPFAKLEKMLFSVLLKKKDRPAKLIENVGSVMSQSVASSSSLENTSTLITTDQLQGKLLPERSSIQHDD